MFDFSSALVSLQASVAKSQIKCKWDYFLNGKEKGDVLCQLVSESPVATVVRHHELLQLVQIFSPLVCVKQLQQKTCT